MVTRTIGGSEIDWAGAAGKWAETKGRGSRVDCRTRGRRCGCGGCGRRLGRAVLWADGSFCSIVDGGDCTEISDGTSNVSRVTSMEFFCATLRGVAESVSCLTSGGGDGLVPVASGISGVGWVGTTTSSLISLSGAGANSGAII